MSRMAEYMELALRPPKATTVSSGAAPAQHGVCALVQADIADAEPVRGMRKLNRRGGGDRPTRWIERWLMDVSANGRPDYTLWSRAPREDELGTVRLVAKVRLNIWEDERVAIRAGQG
jgi:hypothetical protein